MLGRQVSPLSKGAPVIIATRMMRWLMYVFSLGESPTARGQMPFFQRAILPSQSVGVEWAMMKLSSALSLRSAGAVTITFSTPMPGAGSSGLACSCAEAVREKASADASNRMGKLFMSALRDLQKPDAAREILHQ